MHLELPQSEVTLLAELVRSRLDELGPELRHTDGRAYHDALKVQQESLQKVLARLEDVMGAN